MVQPMSILQTTDLKKYYGAEPNITKALDGVTLSVEQGEFAAIVLADEPTGNLDSRTSNDVLGLLKVTSNQFHQTLVMITHNNEIAQLADRIIRIEDGRIFE
jgi:ABC-type lipoprotein export system ATPase subunit